MSELERLRDLKIDEDKLDEALATQADCFLFASEKAVVAEIEYRQLKMQVDQLQASLSVSIREDLTAHGIKVTEKMLEAEVNKHPDFVKANNFLMTKFRHREMLKALKEAWHMRKDMLIQLAINKRTQMEALTGSVRKAA